MLLIGTGWYEVEKIDNLHYRWSGPDNISTIHVASRRDLSNRINLKIYQAASENILVGLRLEADGIPLTAVLGTKRNPAFLTAILPADQHKQPGEKTILTLHLPQTVLSPSVCPDTMNKRALGIALQSLRIFPLSRPLFAIQKYNDPIAFDGIHYMFQNPGVRDAVVHGVYASAYDYFLKHDRVSSGDVHALHENFDECPGDIYDLLHEELQEKCRKMREDYLEEISMVREIVYRQGNMIREMKKK